MANLVERIEIKVPDRMIRIIDKTARAAAIALLMGAAVGPLSIPFGKTDESPGITLTWELVSLPFTVRDGWEVNQDWIKDNCNPEGQWAGTGIPEHRIIGRIDDDISEFFLQLPTPLTSTKNLYRDNWDNEGKFADALCHVFGNSTWTTP